MNETLDEINQEVKPTPPKKKYKLTYGMSIFEGKKKVGGYIFKNEAELMVKMIEIEVNERTKQ